MLWQVLHTSATESACGNTGGLLRGRKDRLSRVTVLVLEKLSAEESL